MSVRGVPGIRTGVRFGGGFTWDQWVESLHGSLPSAPSMLQRELAPGESLTLWEYRVVTVPRLLTAGRTEIEQASEVIPWTARFTTDPFALRRDVIASLDAEVRGYHRVELRPRSWCQPESRRYYRRG